MVQVYFAHRHDQKLNDPGVDDLLIAGGLLMKFFQHRKKQSLNLAIVIPENVCGGIGREKYIFEMDLVVTDHSLKGTTIF